VGSYLGCTRSPSTVRSCTLLLSTYTFLQSQLSGGVSAACTHAVTNTKWMPASETRPKSAMCLQVAVWL
jgi:hypothetical protein